MSNKKPPQLYLGKPPTESGSVPPRYQPPPQPGILKHVTNPQPSQSAAPKDAKQPPYIHKVGPPSEPLKVTQSLDPSKYYPTSTGFVPTNPYPGQQQIGIPIQQQRPHRLPTEEEIRSSQEHHRQRNFEEEVRLQQHGLPLRSVQHTVRPEDGFNRGPNKPDDLGSQASNNSGHRVHEDFPPQRVPVQHLPTYRTQRLSDEELLRLPPVEMLKFVRKAESEGARIATEQHRHIQALLNEIRMLKEANQRLGDDNQELRDLCCFLDDDRQKGRKLAREWQRFGRYTASVMRQEVSAYQNKLRELDNKQQELIKDNLELKELCLYLDEERGGSSVCPSCGSATSGGMRDDGDGSSSSTNADEPGIGTEFNGSAPRRSASRERLLNESLARQRHTFNDQTMQYVRSLEQRVKQLEDDKRALQSKVSELSDGDENMMVGGGQDGNGVLSGRPEAVVRALQVLEVREQLEREGRVPERVDQRPNGPTENGVNGSITSDMDDGEKALVREMCNFGGSSRGKYSPPSRNRERR